MRVQLSDWAATRESSKDGETDAKYPVETNSYKHLMFEFAIPCKSALTRCDFCDKKNAKVRCGGCYEALYCSKNCQTEDLHCHKLICASAKRFNKSTRPRDHIRAIIFPTDSAVPSFCWLDAKRWPSSVAEAFCIGCDELGPPEDVNAQMFERKIAHGILEYNNVSACRKSNDLPEILHMFNRSLQGLTRPGLLPFLYWNLIYCGYVPGPSAEDPITVQDASMKDFRAIVDYHFNSASTTIIPDIRRHPGKWNSKYKHDDWRIWPAIKINCEDDIQRLSTMTSAKTWPLVEDVLTLNSPPSDAMQPPILLAELAGLPWVFDREPSEAIFEDKSTYAGRIFAVEAFEEKDGRSVWKLADSKTNTLFIMNKDAAPIHPDHILAFYDFAESQLEQISQHKSATCPGCGNDCVGEISIPVEELKKWFTRERFEHYWSRWLRQPQRAYNYNHNDGGKAWYPCQRIYESQPAWNPYAFVGKEWHERSSDPVLECIRLCFIGLSDYFIF
ncbi:hypothetical protein GGR53DRAFT_530251 [Hypoxylon sp. FL1150]|nr:hypothetical protein GGR53DRAFT_530251 [Hypoxylon sp. FL1150]